MQAVAKIRAIKTEMFTGLHIYESVSLKWILNILFAYAFRLSSLEQKASLRNFFESIKWGQREID